MDTLACGSARARQETFRAVKCKDGRRIFECLPPRILLPVSFVRLCSVDFSVRAGVLSVDTCTTRVGTRVTRHQMLRESYVICHVRGNDTRGCRARTIAHCERASHSVKKDQSKRRESGYANSESPS